MSADGKRIEVFIAEDNHDLCAALCELIASEPDLDVAGSAATVTDLIDAVASTTAHVLVLDLELAGESSMRALHAFRAAHPRRAIVLHSGHDPCLLEPVLARIGHCEYVPKTGEVQPLLDAIRRGTHDAASAGT